MRVAVDAAERHHADESDHEYETDATRIGIFRKEPVPFAQQRFDADR